MERVLQVLLGAAVLLSLTTADTRCEREDIWGRTQYFRCPEPGGDADDRFCCGFGDNKYCCSIGLDDDIEDLVEMLPTILGVVVGIVVSLIVLCIVCCCCCPFCLLHKRRNRGTVLNPNPEVSVMQPLQHQQHPPPPMQHQAPYPMQPVPPGHHAYPPQAGYPPQPYPPAPYPTDQPPVYTEKQPPAYNPTY